MRRVVLLLFVLFLVNLPFASQAMAERKLENEGRDVAATVLDSRRLEGRNYIDYRLPEDIDPKGSRFSAQVDDATFQQARSSDVLPVRVVPDEPANNRPDGVATNRTFLVVAVLGDTVLLAIALMAWRRHRRWNRHEVVEVEPGLVTLRGTAGTLSAAVPEDWSARVRVADHVSGSFHLVVDKDLLAGPPLSGMERIGGAEYVAHGRVVDTKAGWAVLELADGFRLRVETGPHRIRADIRDSTEARGVLCFTPR